MNKAKSDPDPGQLRVLLLEDNPADAKLIEHQLQRAGIAFHVHLVTGKKEFSEALSAFQPLVILSDFKLPLFDGLAALKIARTRAPEVPFIFVSGSIGEEKAIELLAQGASDYIFKDNLSRLGPAVTRVVEAARLKLEKEMTGKELQHHVDELRLLAEAADHFVQINDLEKLYAYLARTIRDISGADYLLLSLYDEQMQAVRPKIVAGFEPFRERVRRHFHFDPLQMVFYIKDMRADDFSDFVSRRLVPVRDGLYGLANHKLPRPLCRAIEKLLAIDATFTMGFSWENQLYGGLTVFFKKGNELKNPAQVEALLNQAAVAIKRLLAEQALRLSEEKYRALVETSPDAIVMVDAGGCITFASPKAYDIFGVPIQAPIIGTSIMDFVEPEEIPRVQERMVEILSGHSFPQIKEYRLLRQDRRLFWGEISSAPLRDAAGRNIALLLVLRDVSERKQAEDALRASEERLRDIIFSVGDWVWEVDEKGVYTYSSGKGLELFGSSNKDIIGKTPFAFMPADEAKRVAALFAGIVANKAPITDLENWNITKHGERVCLLTNGVPILDKKGNLQGYRGVDKDITAQKRAEELVQASLKEKEVLLQEIHHRVKNNLQIISGLLTLQADQAAGKSLGEIFRESQDRIRSIALIHEKLYRSHNLAEIAFDEYLRALTENLFISHGVAAGRIRAKYEMESIFVNIEKALPLGLIVNELVTNALKHAFPAGRQGEIRIGLHKCRDKSRLVPTDQGRIPSYELIVADDGVGLPAGFEPDAQKSLGMHLISMLAKQLQAELKVKTGPGAEFRLVFPVVPANEGAKDKDHGG